MATSHDIGMLANNQVAQYGNISNFARNIQPLGGPMAGQQQQQQQQAGFGMMAMASTAFTPMGPAFSPPGSFPGQGIQRAAMGITGGAAQAGGAAVPGRGTLGIAGMLAGGPGGLAAGLAAGTMGDFITSTITQTVQNMSATTNMMQAQRFQFGRGQGLPAQGAFSASQIAQVAGGIQNMGMSDVLTSVSEIREITSQLANMGIFQVARDVPDIMGKLGATMKALRTIAVSAQTTLAEAIPILGQLRQAGITQGPQAAAAVQGMAAGQRAGVSFAQQMGAGVGAAQQAMAIGLPGPQAFQGAVDATVNLAKARQTGAISEEDFQRLTMGTGDPSVAGRIMQAQNLNAVQGPMAIVAGGAMGIGGAQPGMFGAAPFGQFLNMAASNLSNPQAMVQLLNRQDQVAGALAADQFSMVRIARSMAETLPGTVDEMTMLVLQRRMGLTPFQARMQMQTFNARHQTQLSQTIDSMAQAETDRMATFMRENSPAGLVNKMGRFAMQNLGGATMADKIRTVQAGIAGDVQAFFGRAAGVQAVATGPGAERALAGLIAGTEDISMLADVRTTGALNPAGGFANALGWNSIGRREGGILASQSEAVQMIFFGATNVPEMDVDSALKQVREAHTQRKGQVMATRREELQEVISDIQMVGSFMSSKKDVEDRYKALGGIKAKFKLSTNEMLTAATLASERFGREILEGVTLGRLNLEEINEQRQKNLTDMKDALMGGIDPVSKTTRASGIKGGEAALLTEMSLDGGGMQKLIGEIAEGYASGDPNEKALAGAKADTAIERLREEGKSQQVEALESLVDSWRRGEYGQSQAAEFSTLQQQGTDLDKKFKLTGAAITFAKTMEQGLDLLPTALKEGTLAASMRNVATALRGTSQVAFSRANERLIVSAITQYNVAEGDVEALTNLRRVAKAGGMGALIESISQLSEDERGVGIAEGVSTIRASVLDKLTRDITKGDKAETIGEGEGGPNNEIHQRQIEALGLITKRLEVLNAPDIGVRAAQKVLALFTGGGNKKES